MKLDLQTYLTRIGFTNTPQVDLATLQGIQRQHLLTIPYEDIDVQLGRPLDRSLAAAYQKLVLNRRGGWCFEMNGVLGWALEEIGFDVQYMSGGVARAERGDWVMGNHLVLQVTLDGEPWLVDAGFGDGFIEPISLQAHEFEQRGFPMRLERLADGAWRFTNHQFGGAPNFDFYPQPAKDSELDAQCQWLQTNEQSPFVKALVVQRFNSTGYDIQVGLMAKTVTPKGVEAVLIESVDELRERLETVFNLHEPELKTLWPKLVDTHERFFQKPAS